MINKILTTAVAALLLAAPLAHGDARQSTTQKPAALPTLGARVRVIAPRVGDGWKLGVFSRLRTEPPCYRIIVFRDSGTRRMEAALSVEDLVALEVSERGDGRDRFEFSDGGAHQYKDDRWREINLEVLADAESRCRVPSYTMNEERATGW